MATGKLCPLLKSEPCNERYGLHLSWYTGRGRVGAWLADWTEKGEAQLSLLAAAEQQMSSTPQETAVFIMLLLIGTLAWFMTAQTSHCLTGGQSREIRFFLPQRNIF